MLQNEIDLLVKINRAPIPSKIDKPQDKALYISRLAWALFREGSKAAAEKRVLELTKLLPQVKVDKDRLEIAGVLMATGNAQDALPIFEDLSRKDPTNLALRARVAEAALASNKIGQALSGLEAILEPPAGNFAQPDKWLNYIDAASLAEKPVATMTPKQVQLAAKIAQELLKGSLPARFKDPNSNEEKTVDRALYMTRMAWILKREGDKPKPADVALLADSDKLLNEALALNPQDPETRRALAQVFVSSTKGPAKDNEKDKERWDKALDLLNGLALIEPKLPGIDAELAQAVTWSGLDNGKGLKLLFDSLTGKLDQPSLWATYINALANTKEGSITPEQMALLMKIADSPIPEKVPDKSLYLSRLSWVFIREGKTAAADKLLDKVLAERSANDDARRELIGVLAAAGRDKAALELYAQVGVINDSDRYRLIGLYASSRKFDEAEKQCDILLKEKPDDPIAKRWIADITLWKGKNFAKAVAMYLPLLQAAAGKVPVDKKEEDDRRILQMNFIEAVSQLPKLSAAESEAAAKIIKDYADDKDQDLDALAIARLALVQYRHFDAKQSAPLFGTRDVAALLNSIPHQGRTWEAATTALVEQTATQPAWANEGRLLMLKAIDKRPKDATNLARLSWLVYQIGFQKRAATVLNEAIALKPQDPADRQEIANVLVATNRFREALAEFQSLAKLLPNDLELKTRVAEVTVWSGNYPKGLELVGQLLKAKPDESRLWTTYVDAFSSVKSGIIDWEIALAAELAVKPLPPQVVGVDAEILYLSRLAYGLRREDLRLRTTSYKDKIDSLLKRALALNTPDQATGRPAPSNAVRLELAGVLGSVQRFEEGMVLLEQVLKADPDNLNLRIQLAEFTLWSGKEYTAKAIARLEALLKDNSSKPRVWISYINAVADVAELSNSQVQWVIDIAANLDKKPKFDTPEEQTTFEADLPAFDSRIGWILFREGTRSKNMDWLALSTQMLERAVALKSTDPKIRRELAGVLTAVGMNQQALDQLKGLELDNNDRLRIVTLLSASKKFADAKKEAEVVLQSDPKNLRAKTWIAELTLWGDPTQAQEALDKLEPLVRDRIEKPETSKAADAVSTTELLSSYVDAASAAKGSMSAPQIQLLEQVGEEAKKLDNWRDRVVFLSRLAWALYREGSAQNPENPKLLKEASDNIEAALKLGPNEAQRHEVAGVLIALGRAKDALPWLKDLAMKEPGDLKLQKELAQATVWSEYYFEGMQLIQKLLEADFNQPDLWVTYIDAAAGVVDTPLTKEQFALIQKIADQKNLPADLKDKTGYYARLAWVIFREGPKDGSNVDVIKKFLDLAIATKPTSQKSRDNLASVLVATKNFKLALPLLDDLARAYPTDPADYPARLAQAMLWNGDVPGALRKLQALLDANFNRPALWVSYLEAASKVNKAELTPPELVKKLPITLLKIADQKVPDAALLKGMIYDQPLYLSRLAWAIYRDDPKSEKVGKLLNDALKLKPEDVATLRELSGVLVATERAEQALPLLEELANGSYADKAFAKALQVELAQATFWASSKKMKVEEKVALQRKALKRMAELLQEDFDQKNLWVTYVDAASSLNKGELTAEQLKLVRDIAAKPVPALLLAEKAREQDPSAVCLYQSRLAWTLWREGQKKEGEELLKKAIEEMPKNAPTKTRDEMAGVMVALNDPKQAVPFAAQAVVLLKQLVAEDPDNEKLRTRLAQATFWSGDSPHRARIASEAADGRVRSTRSLVDLSRRGQCRAGRRKGRADQGPTRSRPQDRRCRQDPRKCYG